MITSRISNRRCRKWTQRRRFYYYTSFRYRRTSYNSSIRWLFGYQCEIMRREITVKCHCLLEY